MHIYIFLIIFLFCIIITHYNFRGSLEEKYSNKHCQLLPQKCECIEDHTGKSYCGFIKNSIVYACNSNCCPQRCNTMGTENPYNTKYLLIKDRFNTLSKKEKKRNERLLEQEIHCHGKNPNYKGWIEKDKIPCWGC